MSNLTCGIIVTGLLGIGAACVIGLAGINDVAEKGRKLGRLEGRYERSSETARLKIDLAAAKVQRAVDQVTIRVLKITR